MAEHGANGGDGAFLALRDIHFTYPRGRKAVDGLSLTFAKGEAVGVIGANGAGKSTLLHLLLGLLTPERGEILLDGVAMTPKTLPEFRRRIGLAMQNPDDQLFMATVGEDVAFGPRNQGLGAGEAAERVDAALALTGASHLRDRPPLKLSGGEKRAAALAAVLAMRPDVVVMDEPTASLDPRSRRRIMEMLTDLRHTKIVTSHDLDMIWATCARVVLLKEGRVAADGPAPDILGDGELLRSCGLEPPLSLQGCPRCGDAEKFRP